MEDMFQVGIITSPHGVRGEVKVFPTTDDNNRFKKLSECFIEYNGEMMPVRAKGCKFLKNMVILKFEDFDNKNDVEKFRQCKILVDREHAVSLLPDEYYIADLLGMTVVNEEDNEIGELTDVIETGANDVYVVKNADDEETLIPAIKECILDINVNERVMKVHLLKVSREKLTDIISELSAISQQNAASTEETNASMEELNATFTLISNSASELKNLADSLNNKINFFQLA